MITRMTTSMMAGTTLATIQRNFNRLADVNKQLSSGKRMSFASDDPASSVSSMRLRKELAATEQFKRNISDANSWLATSDAAMQSVADRYTEARTLLINSIDGALGDKSQGALAAQLRKIAESIMSQANSTYLGRTVFAGNSDKGLVFKTGQNADGDTLFLAAEKDEITAKSVDRRIDADTTVQANIDGNKLFGTGTIKWDGNILETDNNPSVMNLLIEAAKILESPAGPAGENRQKIESIQKELGERFAKLQEAQSAVGARHKQVLEAQNSVVFDLQQVKGQISDVEDIDIQKVTIDMSLASMAYQASLSSTQRVVQPTLLDYLR
ncbi:flagellin [uncultured Mobiluncus sp.]|uniref:flagellin N-terminal helical domain-containing protein n=1 Tax=uncultured Mobiluncus sp. TaxID=293425 RepID=UPI00260482FD|nr:flagellin [uncultured Mobiluncus sp.]